MYCWKFYTDCLRYGSGAISLLNELLKLDWRKRINAIDALKHPYFRNDPLPAEAADIPHFEESHELDRRKFRSQKAAPPPAPKGGTVGMGPSWGPDNGGGQGGFGNGDGYGGVNHRQHHNGNRHPSHSQTGYRNGAPPPPPANDRRPAWHRDRDRDRDHAGRPDTRLPPRPPPAEYSGSRASMDGSRSDRDRDRLLPRSRAGVTNVDTYIPAYGPDSGRRDDRRRWDDRDDRRHNRDRSDRLDYDERSRTGRTRSRSRSPVRERTDRVRERDPVDRADRDRDVYRR